MPSNSEYIKQAEELAAELNIQVTTDGLNNEKLANLVSELKAKKREAEEAAAKAAADEEAAAKAPAGPPPLKAGQKRLRSGKSVTTKRGVVAHPHGVGAADLSGGAAALAALQKRGVVEA